MPTDWTKPFPRDALVITHPDSDLPKFVRPNSLQGILIAETEYSALEEERKAWYAFEVKQSRETRAAALRDLSINRERKMVRDTLEVTADRALAKISRWKRYVDTERWRRLEEWVDSHPQRWTETDHLMGLLDKVDWEDPFALIPQTQPIQTPKRGRPRGAMNTTESNAKRSESAKLLWAERKSRGDFIHWRTAEKSKPKKVEPY